MAINPGSIYPYFKKFCEKGAMQGPDPKPKSRRDRQLESISNPNDKPVQGLGETTPVWSQGSTPPPPPPAAPSEGVIKKSFTVDGAPKPKEELIENTLTEYITAASQYYNDHQLGLTDKPPLIAAVIWEVIAHNIAHNFHDSRNGRKATEGCTPADKPGKVVFSTGTPGTVLSTPGFAAMFTPGVLIDGNGGQPGRAKASIKDDKRDEIKKTIIDWFKANYDYSIAKGKEKGITAKQLAEATAPDTNKQAEAVSKAFNDYFKKASFSAKPGIPLPPALVPKSADQQYFPDFAPHKDTTGNQPGPPKQGSAGYCIGPFYRKVIIEEAGGAKCTVQDGSVTQKSPAFKLSEEPIDDVEFFVDDEAGNQESPPGRLRAFLGSNYASFVRGRNRTMQTPAGEEGGPSGLPVNGGQKIIISYKNPDSGADETIDTGVQGLNTSGLQKPGAAAQNTNYGNPILPEELIAMGYGAPEIDGALEIQNWVRDNKEHVLGASVKFNTTTDKGTAWGSTPSGKKYNKDNAEDPVESYMANAKGVSTTPAPDNGEEGLSLADPRSWGPWTEYANENDKESGEAFPESRRFKHLVPDKASFDAAKGAAEDPSQNTVPGVAFGGATCLPALNKSYWGYRLREAFDESKGSPAGQAISAGSSPQPDSAGILVKNMKGIAGPIPPLKITEKGSKCTFDWSNDTVLVKSGKIGPADGTPFTRADENHPSNHSMYHTIAAHFMDGTKGVKKTIDENVKGEFNGGMMYVDVTKQIIPPYAPPPGLKPFMPNTEKGTW